MFLQSVHFDVSVGLARLVPALYILLMRLLFALDASLGTCVLKWQAPKHDEISADTSTCTHPKTMHCAS